MTRSLLEATDDEILRALAMYNKPALGGAFASPAHEANYRRGLAEAKRILGVQQPAPPSPVPTPDYEPAVYWDSGQIAGTFARQPKGVVLHGSRSGRQQTREQEFNGTRSWAVNNPGGLGWNVTVGEDAIAIHLDPSQWGWHARAASDDYLSVEFAQPLESYEITDGQVRAFVWWMQTHVLPKWPTLPLHMPTHAEIDGTETGAYDGKSDVFSRGSPKADELRQRILAALQQPAEPEPVPDDSAALRARVAELEAIAADRQRRIEELANLVGNVYARDSVVYQALLRASAPKKTHAERKAEIAGVLAFLDDNRPAA